MTQRQRLAAAAAVFHSAYARRAAAFLAFLEERRLEDPNGQAYFNAEFQDDAPTGFSWTVADEIQALARHPGRPR